MTFAELFLLVGGGVGIYFLLRPLQRWLEAWLLRRLSPNRPRLHRTVIDVTRFKPHSSQKEDKEDHEQRS